MKGGGPGKREGKAFVHRGDSRAPSWKRAQHAPQTEKALKLGLRARGGVAFPCGWR